MSDLGTFFVCCVATLLAVFAAHAAETTSTHICDDGYDVSEVKMPLKYTGPNQRIHREGKLNFRCFNAQHWEDLYMFQHYFGNITGGFFIELGALDGWSYSVSYFFEQFLNWRGLLLEASPRNYLQFKAKMRKLPVSRRRKSDYILSAVCNDPKPLTYVSKEGTGAGILEFMPEDQQIRNKRMCTESDVLGAGAGSLASIEKAAAAGNSNDCTLTKIQCIHLGDMLRERGVQKVDMFILDVEGAELEVLSSLRLDEIPVHFFLIELDGKAPGKDAKVRCILRKHKYEPIGRLDLNEIWRKTDFDMAKFASSYPQAPVPISHWSGCFRGAVDETFFDYTHQVQLPTVGENRATSEKVHEVVAKTLKDEPQAPARVDPDFEEFADPVEGKKDGVNSRADGNGNNVPVRPEFIYGHQAKNDLEVFNDVTSAVIWLLVLGVPVSLVVIIRRRKRRVP
jgi:FkbM family methyltransferase